MKVKAFTHESGFNSIQGKYSIGYNTRGLLMASEEYCESKMKNIVKDSSDIRMRVNEFGDLVYPPEKPVPPKPLDESNWVNITPKRREKRAQYKKDLESYEHEMVLYEMEMERWLQLPFADEGRTRDEFIHDLVHALRTKPTFHGVNYRSYYNYMNGTFETKPDYVVLSYFVKKFGQVRVCSKPVTHTELEIVEVVEGESWIKQDILDIAWRRAEVERMRKEKKQHYRKFIREQEDNTVQITLTGNCFNEREVTSDMLHNFTGDAELVWKFFINSFKVRGCLHGSVDINEVCFSLTKEELDEVYSRKNGGK